MWHVQCLYFYECACVGVWVYVCVCVYVEASLCMHIFVCLRVNMTVPLCLCVMYLEVHGMCPSVMCESMHGHTYVHV